MFVNRIYATVWRWILILIVYALLAVPVVGLIIPGAGGVPVEIPMLFQNALKAAAFSSGFFPDNMYYSDWQFWLSGYSTNALIVSLSLVALWNAIYSPPLLGRNRERSVRFMFFVFAALHIAALLFLLFIYFTRDMRMWQFAMSQPFMNNMVLFMPQLLMLPFVIVLRALCPYRVYHMFPVFRRIRAPLGLRVYSRKGAV